MKALKSQLHTWSGSSNTLPRPTPAPTSGRTRWLPHPWRSARRQSPSSVPNQFKIYYTAFTRLIRSHWSLINSRSRIPCAYLNMIYILLVNNFNQSFNVSLFLHQSEIIMCQFSLVNQSIYSSAWPSNTWFDPPLVITISGMRIHCDLFHLHLTSHYFKSISIHNTVINLNNLVMIPIAFDQINQSVISVVRYHLSILYLAILEKFWNQIFKSLHRVSILHTNLQPQHVQHHKIKPTRYLSTKSWLILIKTVEKQLNFWY